MTYFATTINLYTIASVLVLTFSQQYIGMVHYITTRYNQALCTRHYIAHPYGAVESKFVIVTVLNVRSAIVV